MIHHWHTCRTAKPNAKKQRRWQNSAKGNARTCNARATLALEQATQLLSAKHIHTTRCKKVWHYGTMLRRSRYRLSNWIETAKSNPLAIGGFHDSHLPFVLQSSPLWGRSPRIVRTGTSGRSSRPLTASGLAASSFDALSLDH